MTLSPEYRRAVYMLQLGICCIPAHGKRAAVPWKVYQSRFPTPDDLAGWFMGGTENYCVITGAISGLVVVDADTPEAVEYVEANLPESPLVVVTSRGRHYYYGHPGVDVQCITDGIPAGLDLSRRRLRHRPRIASRERDQVRADGTRIVAAGLPRTAPHL